MNKKIICIGIVSLFLLTGLTAVSAVTANNGLPDLKISLSSTKRGEYTVTIENIGDAPAVVPGPKVMICEVHVYRPLGILHDEKIYLYGILDDPLELSVGYHEEATFDNLPLTDSTCTIKAWVDKNSGYLPNGVIEESDEGNNYAEMEIQGKSLSRSSVRIQYFLALLENHPLLRLLAERLL